MKDAKVVAHVERAVKDALEQLAQEDGRKLSSYVDRVLVRYLQQKGRLPGSRSVGAQRKQKLRAKSEVSGA
jgi:hypothetical protein